jgi:hypothetical protein
MAAPDQLISSSVDFPSYNLVCHQLLYSLPDDRQYVGIFVNVTGAKTSMNKLTQLREQTVIQARELLEQQIQMAETVAICLGGNAARAESLLENLMDQANAEK